MGLYLCIFDRCGDDICGIDVGPYQDFAVFRMCVAGFVDEGRLQSKPTLLQHADCDGIWNTAACQVLIGELAEIKTVFQQEPPCEEIWQLKEGIFKFWGISPANLFECFVDSDCEFLVDRLLDLCSRAVKGNRPIVFQ